MRLRYYVEVSKVQELYTDKICLLLAIVLNDESSRVICLLCGLNKITPDFFKQSQQSNFALIVNLSATNGTLAVLTSASYEARVEGPLDVFRVIH